MARTTLFFSSLFLSTALGRTVNYEFTVANGKIAPDGVIRNSATLINNQYPGPLITANKGDTLSIRVNNELKDPSMFLATSIHWHGLHQHRTADEDGPAFVTQCPIIPKASYTYTIPLGDQTGTYWYHGHLGTQYVDGLRGPIVIYPNDPHKSLYDIDEPSGVLVIGDWYHNSSTAIEQSGSITQQQPDSGTINGKGRYDPSTPANPDTLYTLKVKHGKRYRLRVINSSAIAAFRFSVQGHKLTVIEADGTPTEPYTADAFDILPAQRRDVIVEANQAPGTYWIDAPFTNVANKTTQALLIYEDDSKPYQPPKGPYRTCSVSDDVIKYWSHNHGHGHGSMSGHRRHRARSAAFGLGHGIIRRANDTAQVVVDDTKLAPLKNKVPCNPNKPADVIVDLSFGLGQAAGKWAINNITYESPAEATLKTILDDKKTTESSDFTQSEHTVILPKDKCIEFNLKGVSGIPITHPFHFHGHTFSVVQYGNSTPNYIDPPQGDVVGTPDAGVRFRFKTDNPGPWFLHCHIDWHLVEGLAMVFAEAPEAIKKGPESVQVDSQWKNLCKTYTNWFNTQSSNQNPDL